MTQYEKAVGLWQQKKVRTDEELANALNIHGITFAYHSGKLDNEHVTYNDTWEIFDHDGVTSYTGDLRTLIEIRNARNANRHILSAFNEKRKLDEALIRELHFCLTQNTYDSSQRNAGERPGEFKKNDYAEGTMEWSAAPEEVEEELSGLLEELKDLPKEKALVGAAYFLARFEGIAPFADGNGRTGRLAMNYILLINDLPPAVIYEEDRGRYEAALKAWDDAEELEPLIDFLKDQTAKTWEKEIRRAENRA